MNHARPRALVDLKRALTSKASQPAPTYHFGVVNSVQTSTATLSSLDAAAVDLAGVPFVVPPAAGQTALIVEFGGRLLIVGPIPFSGGSGDGSSGVASFNTRTGAVTLSKADVTATGLAAADVGADVAGAAAAVLPSPAGNAGKVLTVNAGGTGYELDTAAGASGGDSAWRTVGGSGQPAYANGWVAFGASPYADAAFRVDALGWVHLHGLMKSGTVGSPSFTLPTGYRPGTQTVFGVIANNALGRIDVATTGSVTFSIGSNTWVNLDGITFVAGQ